MSVKVQSAPASAKGEGRPSLFERLMARIRRRRTEGFYYRSEPLSYRWGDVALVTDFRPTDRVLDMGCAEGLLTMEMATRVASVHGVEIRRARVEYARKEAAKRGLGNVTFDVGSVQDYPLEPDSYDVSLLLGVVGRPMGKDKFVRLDALERVLKATRRQVAVRVGLHQVNADKGIDLNGILETMSACGFDGIAIARFEPQGHLIIGNKRGTDAKLRKISPFVLVPVEAMQDHPCVKGVLVGSLKEFDFRKSAV